MNLSFSPKQPIPNRNPKLRNTDFYRHLQIETTIKLILSSFLALGAITALVKLVPYHFSQQARLREINNQVAETEKRVAQLRAELHRNFDSHQSQNLMEEYSPRLAPHQTLIFWLDREQK